MKLLKLSDATAGTVFTPPRTVSTVPVHTLSHGSQRRSSSWAKQIGGVALIGLSLSLLAGGKAAAISFTFEKIVDTNTPIPGGTGTFRSLDAPSLDNGNVAFAGFGGGRNFVQSGIYTNIGGALNVVADTNTPIPGGTGTFGGFDDPSLDNGNVAFAGFNADDGQSGIYTNNGGALVEVTARGNLLDGKSVTAVFFGKEGLSGNQIAFNSIFDDGSSGVFVATAVPEPSSMLGTLAFSAFGAGWMLKRRQKKQQSTSDAMPVE